MHFSMSRLSLSPVSKGFGFVRFQIKLKGFRLVRVHCTANTLNLEINALV